MRRLRIMVSSADDADRWRDIVEDVRQRLQHSYQNEVGLFYILDSWDYRMATPTVVPRGELAGPSLAAVRASHCLILIVEGRVGDVSREEVLEAFERRANGDIIEVRVFLHEGGDEAALRELADQVLAKYNEQIVRTKFSDELNFQARMFCCLNEELLRGNGDEQLTTEESP